jgi:nucleoside-diphosphate-sugar epimerase
MIRNRVLVTGANGFIGRHLVDRLVRDGTNVRVLIRPGHIGGDWGEEDRLEVATCTDWTESGLGEAMTGQSFDVVFHLAAYGTNPSDRDIDQTLSVNVMLPALLVRLCKERGAALVIAGTFPEYRAPKKQIPVTELSPLETSSLYGTSKAAGGLMAAALAANLDVSLRILRFFHVYGPGEANHRLLPSLVSGLSQGRSVPLSVGTQVRDFVYVADAVEALIRAAAQMRTIGRSSVEIWNICTGVGHSVSEFGSLVAEIVGAPRELLEFGDVNMRDDDVPWLVGNPEKMIGALGCHPEHDLAAGVRNAVAAIIANERARVRQKG